MIEKTCEICETKFFVKAYRRDKARFCSQKCGGVWHARERLASISKDYMKGNKFRVGMRPTNAFAPENVKGAGSLNWKEGTLRQCEHCSAGFRQKPWLTRQNGPARFCCKDCFTASGCFQGDRSSSYVGGKATYRGRGWSKVRAAVVAEQSGNCDECGKHVGKSLPVHHKRPFREFETADEANQRNNLIGLCQSCHMKMEYRRPRLALEPALQPVQEPLL